MAPPSAAAGEQLAPQAIVLAGARPGAANPLAEAAGVSRAILVPLAGQPVLLRVVETLAQAAIGGVVVGLEEEFWETHVELAAAIAARSFDHHAGSKAGPSASVLAVLPTTNRPTLLTAADHGLLARSTLEEFIRRARATKADFVFGLVPHALVAQRFPGSRRTKLRFADGAACGANLYYIATPGGERAVSFWRKMEQHRKRPWRLAAGLGIWTLLRYLCGRLPLTGALAQLSRRTGCQVQAVLLDDPAAAVDVDTEADWALAQAIIAGRA